MPASNPIVRRSKTRAYPLSRQSHFIVLLSLSVLISVWIPKLKPIQHHTDLSIVYLLCSLAGGLILLFKKPKLARVIILISICSFVFIRSSNLVNELKIYDSLFGSKVELTGEVQDDAAYNNNGQYEFNVSKLNFAGDGEYLPGRIRVRTQQNTAVNRGDRIFVAGKLNPALGARTGSISYATIEVVHSNPTQLEKLRLKFFASVYSSMPEPHASLGIGFLAGVRSSIPKDFQDQLSRVGLTHIIAVSGYNLTILVMAISKLGKRFSKYQKFIISLSLIFTFLLITGFSPSVVRAAVVSVISITCMLFGRKISPLSLILISAAITAAVNPVYLWDDIGWWLSFLAFFGVLMLAPAFEKMIYNDKEPGIITGILIESISAQITTAPLIAHIFGTFSAVSLLANLVILPWIPLVMLLVFLVGVVGIRYQGAAILLAVLPKLVLTPMVWSIEKLSALGWASIQLKFSQLGMLASYALMISFLLINSRRSQVYKEIEMQSQAGL